MKIQNTTLRRLSAGTFNSSPQLVDRNFFVNFSFSYENFGVKENRDALLPKALIFKSGISSGVGLPTLCWPLPVARPRI